MTMDGSPPASGSFPQLEQSLVGQVLDGRYKLVKKLGEGGMGEVYAAEHVHIEKRFAVKLLRPEIVSNKEAVSRFRQEARSASSIGHRNIIAIEDFGDLPDGRIYMCMELLNGAPLNDLIKQSLSAERLVNILIQTGHGLAAAHAKNIIHRDMKPENVFVTWTAGGEDIPKLLDFGIAKVSGNEGQNNLTRTGTIFGTPYYMAPEQALGTTVDARTDVYAMGVIMYEVFSGSLPFQGESFMGILTQHITTEPEPVAQRAAKAGRQLPPGIAEIVARCMQKEPNQRFASMDDLVAALVNVYRAVAGAGMSSYMEAFPQSASAGASHFTPPPLNGPVAIGTSAGPGGSHVHGLPAHTPQGMHPPSGLHTPPGMHPPQGPQGPQGPMGPPPGGYLPSGGHQGVAPPGRPGTGPYGAYDPGGSAVLQQPRSKVGLIFAIIAVLAVIGGVIAMVVISTNKKPGDADAGAVAVLIDGGVAPSIDARIAAGALDAGTAAQEPDAALPPIDAGAAQEPDAALPPIDAGAAPQQPDAGVAAPVDDVEIVFSVTPSDAKLFDGRRQLSSLRLKIGAKQSKKITVKADGYKSETVTVSGRKGNDRVSVALKKEAAQPPPLDCRTTLRDPRNQACVQQYCKTHSASMECTE